LTNKTLSRTFYLERFDLFNEQRAR